VFTLLMYDLFCLSSPFMFVFGDDNVAYHTRANVILGDASDS